MSVGVVRLDSIAEVRLGRQRSPKDHEGPQMRPYVRAANVGWEGWKLDDVKYMNFTDAEMSVYRLRRGDLLLGEASGSAREVGKPAIWDDEIEDCAFQNTLIRVRPRKAEPRYLLHYFKFLAGTGKFAARSRGVGINHLGSEALASWEVPLPPIEEQRRIAAILDKADELRAKRRAALAHLDSLTQSIFLDMFGDPLTAGDPTLIPLGELAAFVGGGTPSRAVPRYFEGDICWATSKDMKSDVLVDTQEHVTEEAVAGSATKVVPVGSILVVVKSKVLSHTLPVAITAVPTCFGQDLKAIVAGPGADAAYLAASLRVGSRWLLERARGINTEGLTLDHLRAFPVVRASPAQQAEFRARVEQVASVQTRSRQTAEDLDGMFASLQQQAFSGAL